MKTEEKNSNVPKVRIAVVGQMNVGKSGRSKALD
jgi:predicted GTPase